jgi:hypothetical protein
MRRGTWVPSSKFVCFPHSVCSPSCHPEAEARETMSDAKWGGRGGDAEGVGRGWGGKGREGERRGMGRERGGDREGQLTMITRHCHDCVVRLAAVLERLQHHPEVPVHVCDCSVVAESELLCEPSGEGIIARSWLDKRVHPVLRSGRPSLRKTRDSLVQTHVRLALWLGPNGCMIMVVRTQRMYDHGG